MFRIKNHIDDLGGVRDEVIDGNVAHASTLVTFDFALKERYTDQKIENLTLADRPLLGMLPKDEEFQGDGQPEPLIHGNPQGIAGSSLATAQAGSTNAVGKKFLLTAGDYFGTVDIGDKVIKASRGNPGAFLQNKAVETDGLFEQMADDLSTYAYGNGGGSIGRRASLAGNVITLSTPQDAVNFEEGMILVASANDGSDAAHALRAGNSGAVTAVNRTTGTVTVTNAAGITAFADSDWLFRSGDFKGNTSVFIIVGLGGFIWADDTPPVLYSMTRTSDPQRLAGCRVGSADLVGKGNEERIKLLGAYMTGRYKGPGPTHGFMNPEDWQNLETSLQSRGQRSLTDSSTRFGYETIEVTMGGKKVRLYPDKHCPKGTAFFLRMQNWKFRSMLKMIHTLNGDGLTMLRKGTTNDYEFRLVSYPCLSTNAPGYSGRVALA
jgi:hypothetical protein